MLLKDRWEVDEGSKRIGGQATVYKAFDHVLGCDVAVKILGRSLYDDAITRTAFNREIQALYRLTHPNIVKLIDHGVDEGDRPFMVLEWVERNLADEFSLGPYESWDLFSEIGIPILRGLAYAHSQNRLHRDLKPENILISDDNNSPKIADFGISKITDTLLHHAVTFLGHGTPPYSPPDQEANAGGFILSRDVYAFAVLSLEAITGCRFRKREDALEAAELLRKNEPAVHRFFASALSANANERPRSATEALAALEPEFNQWEKKIDERQLRTFNVTLGITQTVAEVVADRLGLIPARAREYVVEDLNEWAKFVTERGRDGQDDCLVAATQEFRYKLILAPEPKGSLRAVGAAQMPAARLQDIRERAWTGGRVNFVAGGGKFIMPGTCAEDAYELLDSVADFIQALKAQDQFDEKKKVFESWRQVLRAKMKIEEDKGTPVFYNSREIQGKRVEFLVRSKPGEELVEQKRFVKTADGLRIRGEVTDISDDQVVFYIEKGEGEEIPSMGQLFFDADAAKWALRVQEEALDEVYAGESCCAHLGELLAYPEKAKPPQRIEVAEFFQDLDPVKQDCVCDALGTEDLLVIKGPPGTGKTTFIAELILQYLRRDPSAKILLASQTHVALDNALERIRKRDEGRRLLRLGRAEKISDSVMDLSVYPQLREWRSEALESGRKFLRERATSRGLDPVALEVSHLARSYQDADHAIRDARSSLKRQRDELRILKDKAAETDRLFQLGLEAVRGAGTGPAPTNPTAELEARSALESQIDDREEAISGLVEQVDARNKDLERRHAALAKALHESQSTEAEVLLSRAKEFVVDDEDLRRLYDLHLEWDRECGIRDEFIAGLVSRAEVVASTCVGLASTPARSQRFDLCIVDEASKATATEILVPMATAACSVLVGDKNQLPPFNEEILHNPEILGQFSLTQQDVQDTLFDRLSERLMAATRGLTHQHRMVPTIGRLISDCFYDKELTSEYRDNDELLMLALGSPVVWYSTSKDEGREEKKHGTSRYNELECRMVLHLLQRLANLTKLSKRRYSVAVLTGYAAQRLSLERRVRAAANDLTGLDLMVNTVDAFQGQEADVCIFSMTRSNPEGQLGFLKWDRRINVALSRGREALLIVGDAEFCAASAERPNPMIKVFDHIERSSGCSVVDGEELL